MLHVCCSGLLMHHFQDYQLCFDRHGLFSSIVIGTCGAYACAQGLFCSIATSFLGSQAMLCFHAAATTAAGLAATRQGLQDDNMWSRHCWCIGSPCSSTHSAIADIRDASCTYQGQGGLACTGCTRHIALRSAAIQLHCKQVHNKPEVLLSIWPSSFGCVIYPAPYIDGHWASLAFLPVLPWFDLTMV